MDVFFRRQTILAFPLILTLVLLSKSLCSEICEGVEIVSRSSWNGRPPLPDEPFDLPLYHVIIAHTVTPECSDLKSCSERVRSMQNYHMDNLAFPDIGYNFMIGGDGLVYEGTGWTVEGTHTPSWNSKSLGIAFIGNFMSKVPNEKMMIAARKLIVCGIKQGMISIEREVHGARDAMCTLSPGNALYELIKKWPRFKGGRLPGYVC